MFFFANKHILSDIYNMTFVKIVQNTSFIQKIVIKAGSTSARGIL